MLILFLIFYFTAVCLLCKCFIMIWETLNIDLVLYLLIMSMQGIWGKKLAEDFTITPKRNEKINFII